MNLPHPSSSLRPPSSASSRPPSSLSRPSSSASQRTASRLSTRPLSRHSVKPPTRQSARVAPLTHSLVTLVTGLSEEIDGEHFKDVVERAAKKINSVTKQGMDTDMKTIETRLKSLSRKARVQSHDVLAEALDLARANVRAESEKETDLDSEIKISRLPDHMLFLLALGAPPTDTTLVYAENFVDKIRNPPLQDSVLTWKDILADEPFEGQHWEGAYGLPAGSIKSNMGHLEDTDSDSTLSLLSDDENQDILSTYGGAEESEKFSEVQTPPPCQPTGRDPLSDQLSPELLLREDLEILQTQQYWRDEWHIDADISRRFNVSVPATLGPTLERNLSRIDNVVLTNLEDKKYINEHDAVREVLLALQGHTSLLYESHLNDSGKFEAIKVSETSPSLLHLSRASQMSLLSVFASHATALAHLRIFSKTVISSVTRVSHSPGKWHLARTVEAFAEAVDVQVQKGTAWCSRREESILRSASRDDSMVVSLLSLDKAFQDEFSDTFTSLLDILHSTFRSLSLPFDDYFAMNRQTSPSTQSSTLLDALFTKAQIRRNFGDSKTATALMEAFIMTAEPVWRMCSRWLSDGIFGTTSPGVSHLEDEFFIEENGLSISDRDFWSEGYVLRSSLLPQSEGQEALCVPIFLRPMSDNILCAGKSMGLLRILDDQGDLNPGVLQMLGTTHLPAFRMFLSDALNSEGHFETDSSLDLSRRERSLTIDDFTLILRERLLPRCQVVEKSLLDVLFSDCSFSEHLSSIEGLFLMRMGDTMADFCEVLFAQMDERKPWTDFHFLNSAFRDTVDFQRNKWINSSLVRLTYRGSLSSPHSKFSAARQSVRGIGGITVEYAAPFPLYYVFDQQCIQTYNDIFVLLVQLRRAKTFLDGIMVRRANIIGLRPSESKALYATRGRLSWVVNTIYNFMGVNVLQVESLRFCHQVKNAMSLDEVILQHRSYLARMTMGCFLDVKTANIHKAILSVLDLSMSFGRNFASLSGEANVSADISRLSISVSRHKSRRLRRLNKDVISFLDSRPLRLDDDSEDSDSDAEEFAESGEIDVSFEEEAEADPFSKNEKISSELDSLVRYLRNGVEALSTSTSNKDAGAAFSVLSFALQDWDL